MKRPAFQFYPADWRKDVELQSCSMAAQGLWINLMCVMHECEPYGHAAINGRAMTAAQIGRQVGLTAAEAEALLSELLDAGVAKREGEGPIYSKRMVSDERVRNARAEGGKSGAEHGIKGAEHGAKGGRPAATKGGSETPLQEAKEPPPSSSSSSSPSGEELPSEVVAAQGASPKVQRVKGLTVNDLVAEGVSHQHAADWLKVRRDKKSPLTVTAWDGVKREARIAGMSPAQAVQTAAENGWQGFKASWLQKAARSTPESFRERDARLAAERVAQATGGLSVARSELRQALPFEEGFVVEVQDAKRIA